MSDLETFLAGRAPDHVVIVLADSVLEEPDVPDEYAERVDGGLALVLGGATGREVFQRLAGEDPMAFARSAGDRDGRVERDLSGGDCPAAGAGGESGARADGDADDGVAVQSDDHHPRLLLSFAEPRNEEVGGLYAEGPVVHAYVECACDTRYADRWVVGGDA